MTIPRTPRTVKDDLTAILGTLIERGIADDQNFPVLRQVSGTLWEVSFDGAEHVSFAMGEIDYRDVHKELSEKRSYNVRLIDGGLLQLMYRFEGESLVKHRLAISTRQRSTIFLAACQPIGSRSNQRSLTMSAN